MYTNVGQLSSHCRRQAAKAHTCDATNVMRGAQPVAEIVPNTQPTRISHDKLLRRGRLRVFRTPSFDGPQTAERRFAFHNLKQANDFSRSTLVRIPESCDCDLVRRKGSCQPRLAIAAPRLRSCTDILRGNES